MLKRTTKTLIIGNEAHVVSCASTVDCSSADKIVDAMAHGHVKLMGHGVIIGSSITNYVNTKGEKDHFPNRAERLTLINVEKRRAFATLADVMPESAKKDVIDTDWHEERITIDCHNCHTGIPGKRRVRGKDVQIFQPDSKSVTHIGKRWYCGCTTKPGIPSHSELVAQKLSRSTSKKAALWPHLKGGVTIISSEEKVTLTITVTPDIAIRIMQLMGGK